MQSFEDLSKTQKSLLSENQKIWESNAVGYFRDSGLDRKMKAHFEAQASQVAKLEQNVQALADRISKTIDELGKVIDNEYFKKKYLESESNLSRPNDRNQDRGRNPDEQVHGQAHSVL